MGEEEKRPPVRLKQEDYRRLQIIKHQMELDEGRDVSFADAIGIILDERETRAKAS